MRVVVLTADGRRHDFVTRTLAADAEVVGVVRERRSEIPPPFQGLVDNDRRIVKQHWDEREAVERRMLGTRDQWNGAEVLETAHGGVNSPEAFDWIQRRRPDLLVLFGSSIIRLPLLEAFANRVVNLHLGLSPYYRGSATNFWPLVHGEPECVGATIHLAVPKVDAGPILAQVRPEPAPMDRAHEMGTGAVMAGARLLPRVIAEYIEGRLAPQTQDLSAGRVFRARDFTADALRRMWRNFDEGMMASYLADLAARQTRYPVVEFATVQSERDRIANLA